MASVDHVKQYLAHWLLLGKSVHLHNGQVIKPQSIVQGDRYSPEFEQCWQQILAAEGRDCYLEGTDTTIQALLSPAWDLILCARCDMPIPLKLRGTPPNACPCHDIPSWPNSELPKPRLPKDTQEHLRGLRDRLQQIGSLPPSCPLRSQPSPIPPNSPGLPYAMAVHLLKPRGSQTPPISPPPSDEALHCPVKQAKPS
ncbi:hypothetical protein [Spirulina subsalsa]|uniref:hypothetical protein n=1 Tax=Spirulina subsalsa TaxID=54311 RepID=UPI0002D27712|nr:hypothetical protein [Spirulina subsalsa]